MLLHSSYVSIPGEFKNTPYYSHEPPRLDSRGRDEDGQLICKLLLLLLLSLRLGDICGALPVFIFALFEIWPNSQHTVSIYWTILNVFHGFDIL